MMSRHFRMASERSGPIAKRLPYTKNQFSVPGSFFNQFVTDIYILTIKTINLCNELIQETATHRKLIFGMWESFDY